MGDRVLLDRDCLKGAVHPKVIGALSLLSGEKRTQCKSGVAHDVKGGDDDVRGPLVLEETTTKTRVVDYMLPYCRLSRSNANERAGGRGRRGVEVC